MNNYPTLFLLSDSTVQSYEECYAPQTGWGQVLYENFKGSEHVITGPPEHCSYPQGRTYHLPGITIENRAIGGRSSRSFIEEGKLAEAASAMKPGDYVFVQFGHNDATPSRPARYVPAEHFADYLKIYAETCRETGALCVFVTPVARRNCGDTASLSKDSSTVVSRPCRTDSETTEEESFKISFPEYRDKMIQFAAKNDLPLLDLGKRSTDYLNQIGREESKKLYLHTAPGEYSGAWSQGVEDNTHLSLAGARTYSRMVAELIRENRKLEELKKLLLPPVSVNHESIFQNQAGRDVVNDLSPMNTPVSLKTPGTPAECPHM